MSSKALAIFEYALEIWCRGFFTTIGTPSFRLLKANSSSAGIEPKNINIEYLFYLL